MVGESRLKDNSGAKGDGCARDGANDCGAVVGVADVSIGDDDSVIGGVVGGGDEGGVSRFKYNGGAE